MLLLKYAEATKKTLGNKIVHLALDEQKMFAYHSLVALVFATLKLHEMDSY